MTRLSARPASSPATLSDGLRPVSLRTDLRPLADLIELVFADSMDQSGRSALREMRYLSHIGYGLNLIPRLNHLALGISLGYVYLIDGRLIGNVSIYPADYPKDMGAAWILANVVVHPECQRRGIAGRLIEASLDMIRKRKGKQVILQVNYDNLGAQRLYQRHGFIYERAWRLWRRSGFVKAPAPSSHDFHIARPRRREWQSEFTLAQAVRPNSRGGLGWLMPLHRLHFHTPLWKRLVNAFSLNHVEKLVIRDQTTAAVLASCWLESTVSSGSLRTRLFTSQHIDYAPYADALMNHVLRRFSGSTILLEHPKDDQTVSELLKRYQFKVKRELWHMRLDL